MNRRRNVAVAIVGIMAMVFAGTGCSAASKGGDTTCKEYQGMSSSDKTAAVKSLLQENGGEASNGAITLSKASASLFCSTMGSDSSKIREING